MEVGRAGTNGGGAWTGAVRRDDSRVIARLADPSAAIVAIAVQDPAGASPHGIRLLSRGFRRSNGWDEDRDECEG